MALRTVFVLAFVTLASAAGTASSEPCDAQDHLSEVRCTAAEVARLNEELGAAYQKALDARPERDEFDLRKVRDQLRKSQLAWEKYKDENCTLLGGLEGGSNLWVTDFSEQCEKDEIQKRIEFLNRVATGSFGG